MFRNILTFETIRVIDEMKLTGFDYVANPNGGRIYPKPDMGVSSRGIATKQHDEIYVILFNKWKILIRKIIK